MWLPPFLSAETHGHGPGSPRPCALSCSQSRRPRHWSAAASEVRPTSPNSPDASGERSGPMDQQGTDIAVAAFADPAKDLALAARTLSWYKPEPGREVTPGSEALGVIHREDERGCGHDPHAGDRQQSLAGIRLLCPGFKSLFGFPDPQLGLAYLFEKQQQHRARGVGQLLRFGIADQIGQFPDVVSTPPGDEAELGKMA